ncbi:hypothetical protein [Bacillus alkalicellulosilyticus]|uniref:hypothetical protein n=1 Tax=Alkalihalobacterium alkalicellulosilyticum TaxID=1912214 RepID=UPI00099616DF|nr:hypothetical protein [Bacillus alkalicellulosilyticus]
MDKSQFLDELRLEVGLVPDYAGTIQEFYKGVIQALGKNTIEGFSAGIYIVTDYVFCLIEQVGKGLFMEREKFGSGELSKCAIRGETTIVQYHDTNSIMAPFYDGHHLIGIINIYIPVHRYDISEEDMIFFHEVSRFIEAQQKNKYKMD